MSESALSLILQGGISLIPLGICSLLVLTVIIERLWAYAQLKKMPQELVKRVQDLLAFNKWSEAISLLDTTNSPYARIAKASLDPRPTSAQEVADALTMACEDEIAHATRPLPILNTIGNIAPFIGLFGTVLGIMRAFQDVAHQGASNSTIVSRGIAEALIATAVGLGIAICAVVANNWCSAWVDTYRRELDHFSTRWANHLLGLVARDRIRAAREHPGHLRRTPGDCGMIRAKNQQAISRSPALISRRLPMSVWYC